MVIIIGSGAAVGDALLWDGTEWKSAGANGWTPISDAWTFLTATTITVPTDATTKYSKGDKIKLTQTTVKYFYVVGVTATVLTITGGTDYTLVNAAISAISYSKEGNPVAFPDWFNFTFGFTGFSVNPTVTTARFRIDGASITVQYAINAQGTSNATTFTMTGLPVAAAVATTDSIISAAQDSGANTQGWGSIASTTITWTKQGGSFTASGGKGIFGFVTVYQI